MSDKDDFPRPHLVALDGDAAPADPALELEGQDAPAPPADGTDMGANDEAIRIKINNLEEEHRALDMAIETLEERMPYDRLAIQRLKKRKLALKDEITALNGQILPDIIA